MKVNSYITGVVLITVEKFSQTLRTNFTNITMTKANKNILTRKRGKNQYRDSPNELKNAVG